MGFSLSENGNVELTDDVDAVCDYDLETYIDESWAVKINGAISTHVAIQNLPDLKTELQEVEKVHEHQTIGEYFGVYQRHARKHTFNNKETEEQESICVICEEQIEEYDWILSLGLTPSIHLECMDEFYDTLDKVWEYSHHFVSDSL